MAKVEKAGLMPGSGSGGYMSNLAGRPGAGAAAAAAAAENLQYSPATIMTRRLHEATLEKIREKAAQRAAEAHVNTYCEDDKTDEGKRMKRLALNRLAASRSRERKKLYVQSLEDRVLELTRESLLPSRTPQRHITDHPCPAHPCPAHPCPAPRAPRPAHTFPAPRALVNQQARSTT